MRQGDVLSPTLFNIFLNGLVKEIKMSNVGRSVAVILAQDESDLQKVLDMNYSWCMKWTRH